MTTRIDWPRSRLILDYLYDWRLSGTHPFSVTRHDLPQQLVPAWIKADAERLAQFYLALCLWMRGTKTMPATRGLVRVVEATPALLDPDYARKLTQPQLWDMLRRGGLPQLSKGNSAGWITNAQRLCDQWYGSVIKLTTEMNNYEQACQLLINRPATKRRPASGFYGFRHKMVSMLLYYLMYDELMLPFLFPVPIDYRIMRFCLANEMVQVTPDAKGNYRNDALEAVLRELFFQYAGETGANPLLLADAVWLYSGLMCAQHPGNKTLVGTYQARSTSIQPVPTDWSRELTTYLATCGQCPFDDTCLLVFPHAYYYRRGTMVGLPRERPPQWQPAIFRGRLDKPRFDN